MLIGTYTCLVGGLDHEFYDFPYIGNVIIPTDFHIFQRGSNHQPACYLVLYKDKFGYTVYCTISECHLISFYIFYYCKFGY